MQTAESVCLWNYQFKNNSPPSPISNISTKRMTFDNTPYLACTERLSCQNEMSSKATFYCVQCNSLQCILCEKEIHENSTNDQHERLNLDEIDDEFCSVDRRHQAVFYCPTCVLSFCYTCYENQHQHSDGREHKPQKCREGQTKPIKIISSSNINTKPSPSSFEDIQVDDSDESPSNKKSINHIQNIKTNHTPKRHNFNEQMLLESMLDDGDHDQIMKTTNRLPQQTQSNINSNKGFLLLDNNEHLTINNESEFLRRLKCEKDLSVKCISIIGNTGDGKSYTLNQVFFGGQEIFHTSSTADSCTMGVWSALDENHRTLILDTEGRLGLSENDNRRNRLLLKILCISDIVIYRTRSSKLPNDMFQFLSDASNAFLKYFRKELENVMKNCKTDGPMSTMGPTLIVFHETQHTGILKDQFQSRKTAVEQLKERFQIMNLSYDAYSSIEYVGIQTIGGKSTDFHEIKEIITSTLDNNNIRSRRRLSVIYKALKV
jgi:zinc finger FYVE domain-containing protein 1